MRIAYLHAVFKSSGDKLPPSFCGEGVRELQHDTELYPKRGTAWGGTIAVAQEPAEPGERKPLIDWRFGKWLIAIGIVFIIVVVPVFPKETVVYVDGTTQTVTNQIQYSTSFEASTTNASSQISVYTGSYAYLSNYYSNNYYYNYCSYCCYWYDQEPICNYGYWPWYAPSYGTPVTVTAAQQVVSVTRTPQPGGLETLTLTYYNGQSARVQNVYKDNLSQSGTATVQTKAIVTSTITDTITAPVTQTVPCHQCVPEHVTEYVSLLQVLLGF